MERRKELLAAVESNSPAAFISFVQSSKSRSSEFDLDEFLQTFSRKEFALLFNALQGHLQRVIPSDCSERELSELESKDQIKLFLAALLALISSFLKDKARAAPESLTQIVSTLHDLLLYLADLAADVADVCEQWVLQEREGKDSLVPATLTYLLVKSIHESAKAADVKRIYNLRHGLRLIDFQDDSSTSMKRLLLSCTINPLFLRTADGIKFIVYLFSIYHPFVDDLHMTIKAQSLLEAYSEVYYKAWKTAAGPFLKKLGIWPFLISTNLHLSEYDCIQDLVHCAVHAANVGVAAKARQVLDGFHQQKKQKGVDEMLLRLYEPVVRRSLHVANPVVRRNAAALLIDAFPLQNPEAPQREVDSLLQEQFEMLQALLQDTDPSVRVTGVHGVCRILGVFWELVPSATLRALITRLVADMASDGSSGAVRAAVFDGLRFILENHLSQPLLQTLLPRLSEHIHDSVESVRSSFINLLLFVKTIRLIKFYDIVGIEQLLARLALPDSPSICQRITRLLLNSYFPINKPTAEQLKRAVILTQTDGSAAKTFFSYVHTLVPTAAIVKLITTLHRAVLRAIREQGVTPNATPSGSALTTREPQVLERVMDIVGMLWANIADEMKKEENQPLQQFLEESITAVSLRTMQKGIDTPAFQAAVLKVAAHLPDKAVNCVEYISKLAEATDSDAIDGLLTCVATWGKASELISELDAALTAHTGRDSAKGKPAVRLSLESTLKILERTLALPVSRTALLSSTGKVTSVLQSLCALLPRMFGVFKSHVDKTVIESDSKIQAMRVLGKLVIHRLGSEGAENRDYSAATEFVDWTKQAVLVAVRAASVKDERHVHAAAEICTAIAVELITTGVCNSAPQGLQASIMSTVSHLIQAANADLRQRVVPIAAKLVWALCSTSRSALAEPLLDVLATLAPEAAAPRQCIVDVAVLSGRRADVQSSARRLLTPAVAAVELPTTLPASLATNFDELPAPTSGLLRHVCKTAAGAETLRTAVAEYMKREGYTTTAIWRSLEVLSCALNDDDSKATSAAIGAVLQELLRVWPRDDRNNEGSPIPPELTRGAAEQLLAECTA